MGWRDFQNTVPVDLTDKIDLSFSNSGFFYPLNTKDVKLPRQRAKVPQSLAATFFI